MEFKLVLVPKLPDQVLLRAEKPLSGLVFLENASKCLRRSLDSEYHTRHNTLGTIAQYTITVPQRMAIESGHFRDRDTEFLPCEANILSKYVFYGASMSSSSKTYTYPYYSNEVVLTSFIDELAFLDVWRARGYPCDMTLDFETGIPLVDDESDIPPGAPIGSLILDRIEDLDELLASIM